MLERSKVIAWVKKGGRKSDGWGNDASPASPLEGWYHHSQPSLEPSLELHKTQPVFFFNTSVAQLDFFSLPSTLPTTSPHRTRHESHEAGPRRGQRAH